MVNPLQVNKQQDQGDIRCIFCHDSFEQPQTPYECPSCKALLHQECVAELKNCPTLGCDHRFIKIKALEVEKVVSTSNPHIIHRGQTLLGECHIQELEQADKNQGELHAAEKSAAEFAAGSAIYVALLLPFLMMIPCLFADSGKSGDSNPAMILLFIVFMTVVIFARLTG